MNQLLVLGAARSGTTAITQAIAAASECAVTDISARIGLLYRLTQAAKTHAKLQAVAAPTQPAPAELPARGRAALIDDLCASLPSSDPSGQASGGRQLLHAPDVQTDCPNLKAAAILLRQWPQAQAVVVWRQGIDFVNSRLRAFPHLDFASHCLTWSTAMAEMHQLCDAFESRVLVIEHGEMLRDPASVAARLRNFLELTAAATKTFARTLTSIGPGRTAAFTDNPVLDLARTGWAMPEIAMFRALCGEASLQAGHPVGLAAAERTHPLDLMSGLLERGHAVGGLTISLPDAYNTGAVIANAGAAGSAGAGLHLSPLTAGRRTRLRLRMTVDESDADAALRCEVVESLSRRPIFGRLIPLRAREEATLDEILPAHDGLLDFSFSQAPAAAPRRFKVTLQEAVLSYG